LEAVVVQQLLAALAACGGGSGSGCGSPALAALPMLLQQLEQGGQQALRAFER
jgi:hypothetical protein